MLLQHLQLEKAVIDLGFPGASERGHPGVLFLCLLIAAIVVARDRLANLGLQRVRLRRCSKVTLTLVDWCNSLTFRTGLNIRLFLPIL